jgi:hypothetical protein
MVSPILFVAYRSAMSEPSPLAQKLAGIDQFPKKTPTDIHFSHIVLS